MRKRLMVEKNRKNRFFSTILKRFTITLSRELIGNSIIYSDLIRLTGKVGTASTGSWESLFAKNPLPASRNQTSDDHQNKGHR